VSLRARLLLGTALIALVLAVSAVAIARATRAHLVDQVDAQLQAGLREVGEPPRGPGAPGDADDGPALSRYFVGFLTEDGELVPASRYTSEDAPTPSLDDAAIDDLRAGGTITVPSDDASVDYRMREGIDLRDGRSVVIALLLDDVDEAVRRLIAVEGAAVLAVLGVLGLVMWWVIHLGVRPVQRMTETAGAIAAGDL
jgi:two-component system OmpR family sensor kinase